MHGQLDCKTLCFGRDLSCTLIELERFDEANHLLKSLHIISYLVHGENRSITKAIEEKLQVVANAISNNHAS
jgi:hypothetical protein